MLIKTLSIHERMNRDPIQAEPFHLFQGKKRPPVLEG
jgi:hypothetical protein